MQNAFKALSKLFAVFTLVFSIITGTLEIPSQGTRYPEVSKDNIVLADAYFLSQDVTTDGNSWYFSCKTSLSKAKVEGIVHEADNVNAIPEELSSVGVSHIGGISYYDGKLYCAMEDSKVFEHPTLGVYDAATLEYLESAPLSLEYQLKGCPWVAVDAERGYIYSSQRDNAPCLIVYDLTTYAFVKTIDLSQCVHKIQGGEMYGDMLYVSTQEDGENIYRINVLTGEVEFCFSQNLTDGSEAEGLTILATPDGAFIHTLDMGPLFVNAFFRHYAYE